MTRNEFRQLFEQGANRYFEYLKEHAKEANEISIFFLEGWLEQSLVHENVLEKEDK